MENPKKLFEGILSNAQLGYIESCLAINRVAATRGINSSEGARRAHVIINQANCHLNSIMLARGLDDLSFVLPLFLFSPFSKKGAALELHRLAGRRFTCKSQKHFFGILEERFKENKYLYLFFPRYPEHSLVAIKSTEGGIYYFDKEGFCRPYRLYSDMSILNSRYESGVLWISAPKAFEHAVGEMIRNLNAKK